MQRIPHSTGALNRTYIAVFVCAIAAIPLQGQTFTSLLSFNGDNGYDPRSPLVQATDGFLYGTTGLGLAFLNECLQPAC